MQMDQMETGGMELKDYLAVILDRKWIVLLVFLLITAAAVYYAEILPPVYQSMAVLMSESNVMTASVFPMMDPLFYRDSSDYLTNLERLVATEDFAAGVVKKMSEDWGYNIGLYEVRSGMLLSNPPKTEIVEVTSRHGDPRMAAALANSAAEVLIEKTSNIKNADTNRALEFLSSQLETVDRKLRDVEEKLYTFREREGIVGTTTYDSSSFGSKSGVEKYQRSSLVGQFAELQDQLAWVRSEKELTQANLDSVNSLIAEKMDRLAAAEEIDYLVGSITPQISQLQARISDWQLELSVLQENYTDKHYKVVELKEKIEDAQKRLRSEIDSLNRKQSTGVDPISEWQSLKNQAVQLTVELKGLEHREKLAAERVEKFKKENPDLLDKEVQLIRLEREARIREKTHMLLTDRYEEMLLLKQVNAQEFRLVDRASPSQVPISPNKSRIITIGVLLGLILGIGLAWLLEYLDDSIRRVDDVERHLGLPIVGSIPRIQSGNVDVAAALPPPDSSLRRLPDRGSGGESGKLSREHRKHILALQSKLVKTVGSKSPVAESYRSLWTNIQFADPDNPVKTVLVTSPGPQEGKSLTTANLALTIAQTNRVLLIDADLRRPTMHQLFGCQRSPGLSELIAGGDLSNIEEYTKNTYADNLYVLPSGEVPPNPVGILGSERMKQLVNEAKKRFDMVLFDSPPVIAMADASVLATGLDLTLLVLHAGQTKRQLAAQAKELMQRLRVNIFGVVLNGVDYSKRYGYYYYYYHYHSYYHRAEKDEAV